MNRFIWGLVGGLTVTLAMSSYTQAIQIEFKNTSAKPIVWEHQLVTPTESNPPPDGIASAHNHEAITLEPYFAAGCALFGVHDGAVNQSRFFCINQKSEGEIRGQWFFGDYFLGFDIEGLDYDGAFLYFSSGDDTGGPWKGLGFNGALGNVLHFPEFLLENCRFDYAVAFDGPRVNGYPLTEVDGITFDYQGNMWGWSQDAGLFAIPAPYVLDNRRHAQLILPTAGEVEDIEFLNNKFYGVMNINHEHQAEDGDPVAPDHPIQQRDVNAVVQADQVMTTNLIEYDPFTGQLDSPCAQQVTDVLNTAGYKSVEIEALEVLPKIPAVDHDLLLLGFHSSRLKHKEKSDLVLGVLDLAACRLTLQHVHEVSATAPGGEPLDVEGLAMVCPTAP